jgi:TonB family protein
MLNQFFRFVCLVLPAACMGLAHAGPDGLQKRPVPKVTVSLDASTARLPSQYRGSDCVAIVRKIKSYNLGKSEYETSAAYASRMATLGRQKLDGTHTLSDPVAFVEPAGLGDTFYDADAGRLNVKATWGAERLEVEEKAYRGSVMSEAVAYDDGALVSNSYGASVRGSKSGRTVCAVAFSNFPYSRDEPALLTVSVSLTPTQAKAAKQHLALLYVGTVAAPYLGTYSRFQEATLDTPHQIVWNGDSVVLILSEVWLFDRVTGTILHKEPVGQQEADRVAAETAPVPSTTKHGGSIEMNNCKPVYPLSSRRMEETGTVALSFLVTPEGKVRRSELIRSSGFRALDHAASEALSKCRFNAALEGGAAVPTWVDVQYRFNLD